MERDEPAKTLDRRFDIPIVSLYSRDTPNRFETLNLSGNVGENQYYTYSYYDALKVDKVPLDEADMLLTAYRQAIEEERENRMLRQFFLVFMDVYPESHGKYSQAEIDRFWEDRGAPLFFMTMLTLKGSFCLQDILEQIHNQFPPGRHLAYLTFDHCHIVIFSRSDSFKEHAKLVFQLDYGYPDWITDSITIYNFAPERSWKPFSREESFPALLSVGVTDYPRWENFWNQISNADQRIQKFWLLGRNDVALFHPKATISWLRAVKKAAESDTQKWYTTYELFVLIQQSEFPSKSPEDPNNSLFTSLSEKMFQKYQEFEEAYRLAEPEPDPVWLRWLKDSSQLAVSLAAGDLSTDLGVCLAPQFFDFFTYAKRLFLNADFKSSYRKEVQDNFTAFFFNLSVLIDSINHSNRQFVQVPSFHSVSFEIPPRVMAYYMAMAHRMIQVFQDDNAVCYGVTIAPKYVTELEVSSITVRAMQGPDADQFITISVDEASLYTLSLTTETIAHEISHFVGKFSRCREVRKKCMLRCALQEIVLDLVQYVAQKILRDCRMEQPCFCMEDLEIAPHQLALCVEKIWEKLQTFPEFDLKTQNCGDGIRELIYGLPDSLFTTPELLEVTMKQVKKLLLGCSAFQTFLLRYTILEVISNTVKKEELTAKLEQEIKHCRKFWLENADYTLWHAFQNVLRDYASEVRALALEDAGEEKETRFGGLYKYKRICDAFRETFADLQAILLLDMDWSMYCNLLKRKGESLDQLKDITNRMVAVGRTLRWAGNWERKAFESSGEDAQEWRPILSAINQPNLSVNELLKLGRGLDYPLLFNLELYLNECKKKIDENLKRQEPQVKELQQIHSLLYRNSSVFEWSQKLMEFIDRYKNQL